MPNLQNNDVMSEKSNLPTLHKEKLYVNVLGMFNYVCSKNFGFQNQTYREFYEVKALKLPRV